MSDPVQADAGALAALTPKAAFAVSELRAAAQEYEDSAYAMDTPALAGFRARRIQRATAIREAADVILALVQDAERLDWLSVGDRITDLAFTSSDNERGRFVAYIDGVFVYRPTLREVLDAARAVQPGPPNE